MGWVDPPQVIQHHPADNRLNFFQRELSDTRWAMDLWGMSLVGRWGSLNQAALLSASWCSAGHPLQTDLMVGGEVFQFVVGQRTDPPNSSFKG